jgi:hypothetical protein
MLELYLVFYFSTDDKYVKSKYEPISGWEK